ncbi:cleavage stimulation factor subunit 1 isoform X1 [Syngnathoides biaculeatus]|uniref:cleavage stimulation factor subunit 1 isoform X1 n=2 Tax=Syngnathoides biaculeatus TaxID=300417 RepID=UPI002ADDF427|nr:cleavage stimulation factor subunit 1 isoform X1 [Syngnathoides biaculeatus]XP_061687940.1 cleavage stimulation factor subunit 1 isoform X1 [Syngnathoides biaculeatus]XP_061687941.1 cleavage stimulation factor subunit 1 isoform X1 [Syngnathoides biaculeatus]
MNLNVQVLSWPAIYISKYTLTCFPPLPVGKSVEVSPSTLHETDAKRSPCCMWRLMMFHIPRASFCSRGLDCQGLCLWPPPSSHRTRPLLPPLTGGEPMGMGTHVILSGLCLAAHHGMENDDSAVQYAIGRSDTVAPGVGIDLEFDADVQTMSPEASEYETCYVTSHKGPCRVATYSRDGQLIATGSADASIKILDTERMLAKSAMPIEVMMNETAQQNMENHPVIRTLYDHVDEVTCLAFHPTEQILASGSRDYTLKLFDYSKPSAKRAFKYIQEAEMLRSISFHPSGDFLLVGTQHPTLRLYDVNTFQCFVSCNPLDQHTDTISGVSYNPTANSYVTCSKDGSIKLWDGVSNRCVTTFDKAHDGTEVCSAIFTKNSKYILSSGKDSVVKLWEISTGRMLVKYTGAGLSGRQMHRTQGVFNHTEDYVLLPDERTISLCCWDSRTAERKNLLSLGHNNIVRCIVHSPTNPGFMTCSDDFRARFWYRRTTTD